MTKILTATLAAGILSAGVAQAGTATTTFAVTATVQSTCSATANALTVYGQLSDSAPPSWRRRIEAS